MEDCDLGYDLGYGVQMPPRTALPMRPIVVAGRIGPDPETSLTAFAGDVVLAADPRRLIAGETPRSPDS